VHNSRISTAGPHRCLDAPEAAVCDGWGGVSRESTAPRWLGWVSAVFTLLMVAVNVFPQRYLTELPRREPAGRRRYGPRPPPLARRVGGTSSVPEFPPTGTAGRPSRTPHRAHSRFCSTAGGSRGSGGRTGPRRAPAVSKAPHAGPFPGPAYGQRAAAVPQAPHARRTPDLTYGRRAAAVPQAPHAGRIPGLVYGWRGGLDGLPEEGTLGRAVTAGVADTVAACGDAGGPLGRGSGGGGGRRVPADDRGRRCR
jgi:hypothetical protein